MTARRYTFDATLLASFAVVASSRADAESKLRQALDGALANFGMCDDEPLIASVEIEGELDLNEYAELDREVQL